MTCTSHGPHGRHRSTGGRSSRRKERVLHTRISEDLAEDLRKIAEDLRVPVSNVVRNVLEEAFSMVETVTENVGDPTRPGWVTHMLGTHPSTLERVAMARAFAARAAPEQ